MATLRAVGLRSVATVEPETALDEAIRRMQADPLRTVVLIGDETYMGVFDDATLQSGQIPARVDRATLAVGPYAVAARPIGHPDMTTDEALALLIRRNLDVLPVVENNTFRGVVTRADLERHTAVS